MTVSDHSRTAILHEQPGVGRLADAIAERLPEIDVATLHPGAVDDLTNRVI